MRFARAGVCLMESPTSTPFSKPLPTGVSVGIALGGVALVITVALGALLCYSRQRRRHHAPLVNRPVDLEMNVLGRRNIAPPPRTLDLEPFPLPKPSRPQGRTLRSEKLAVLRELQAPASSKASTSVR
ncbi:hypothetical protein EXIGLDRAFT_832903 [Exidia glandulosa HHB12029]|uniref:Uncharacterized protein n=1 Tax=Exidia glandulosa HHB12029 TaxID=1314781 RepID=A0A165L4I6_EXIGL|nr:hypothetical protein EXIGLDRAFT_832903 [Exidia glandulosa HHB12029]